MLKLIVDEKKCKRDGICAAVCPAGIIRLGENNAVPSMIEGGEAFCISCGHCVAVCPHGAMSHTAMNTADCPPADKTLLPEPKRMEHLLRYRRSIRVYRKDPVDRAVLEKLIDIARYAPSGHNAQPVSWRVYYQASEVQKLAGRVVDWTRKLVAEESPMAQALHLDRVIDAWERGQDRICRHAPHLILTHAPKGDRMAAPACTLALAYLDIAAASFGLGTCWAGYFNGAANFWPPLQEALNLPEGHITCGAMMIGYPKFPFHRLPLRKKPSITWA